MTSTSRSSSPFRSSPKPKRLSLPIPNAARNKGPYAPSSAASDVSRLLDPTYASPSPHSPSRRTSATLPTAYVDHAGELHDPDFREFPVLPSPKRRSASGSASPARPAWETGYGAHAHAYSTGGAALGLGLSTGVRATRYALDTDEDADVLDGDDGWAQRRRWSSAYAASSTAGARYSPAFGAHAYEYPAPTLNGSPVSDTSDDGPLRGADGEEDDDPLGFGRAPKRRLSRWRRRCRGDAEEEKDLDATDRVDISTPLYEEPTALEHEPGVERTERQRERSKVHDDEV
jgi:hypothetical protein